MWAIIYFAVHTIGSCFQKYGNHMLLFLQFIDNIVGIWIRVLHRDPGGSTWKEFKEQTNNFGILS